jgi:hypothetical protein
VPVSTVLQHILDNLIDPAQVAALAAFDPHGIDGPHFYSGLGFAPVPGNHHGLAGVQAGIEELATDALRSAGILDGAGELQWAGTDADAFRARIAALPPVLRQYAGTLRAFGVLVDTVHTVLRTGKAHAESLDREATAARRVLLGAAVPHVRCPADLPIEVLMAVHRLHDLIGAGLELYRQTRGALTMLGHEIEALSRQAPNLPGSGPARWIDDSADATGFLDRVYMASGGRALVDSHPAEAHLAAGVLGDAASLIAAEPGPFTTPFAGLVGAAGFRIDQRLYRTGATNSRGEPVVSPADYVIGAATAVPIPGVGPALRARRKTVARALETGRTVQETAGRTPVGVGDTPLQGAAAAASVAGVPFLPSVLDYLDDKGVGVPPPRKPDVRLVRPLRPCDGTHPRS